MGFKIGDIVMRMDGDKRPHKIVDITVRHPLNRNEHTFLCTIMRMEEAM